MGGIHILGRRFQVQSSWVGSSAGDNSRFRGRLRLCLLYSGAVFASWGDIFTWLRAQRAAFLGLEGARLWLWNSGEAFASRGAVFRFRVLGWEAQRADFFGFRGRLVVFDELWGGTCTLGRRFHVFGSSEGGIFQVQRVPGCGCEIQGRSLHLGKSFFKSRGRLDGAAGFRGRHLFTSTGRLVAAELKGRHFL